MDFEDQNIGLEELRLVYEREELRNNTIESKTAGLFGFSSLLITVLIFTMGSLLSNPGNIPVFLLRLIQVVNISGIIIIFLGLISLLKILKIRDYITPFGLEPNDIRSLLSKEPKKLKMFIIEDYRKSITHFYCLNNKKADLFEISLNRIRYGVCISLPPLIAFLIFRLWM